MELLEIQFSGCRARRTARSRLLGSDANFAAVRRTAPFGRAEGTVNLDSDPKNLHEDSEHRATPPCARELDL